MTRKKVKKDPNWGGVRAGVGRKKITFERAKLQLTFNKLELNKIGKKVVRKALYDRWKELLTSTSEPV